MDLSLARLLLEEWESGQKQDKAAFFESPH